MCDRKPPANQLRLPGLRLDLIGRRTWLRDKEVHLTSREFAILAYFASHPHELVTKRMLFLDVWGFPTAPRSTRTVDAHVSRLRRKLDFAAPGCVRFVSERGVGWRLR
jgi:DNA-binding response OmpR family regulator